MCFWFTWSFLQDHHWLAVHLDQMAFYQPFFDLAVTFDLGDQSIFLECLSLHFKDSIWLWMDLLLYLWQSFFLISLKFQFQKPFLYSPDSKCLIFSIHLSPELKFYSFKLFASYIYPRVLPVFKLNMPLFILELVTDLFSPMPYFW